MLSNPQVKHESHVRTGTPDGRSEDGALESRVVAEDADQGLKDRMTRQGEEAIGKLAQELLENPMVSGALSAALGTRERAMRAQARSSDR